MALIDCPECKARVSDQAVSCPSCGHPLRAAAMPPPVPQQKRFDGPPVNCRECGGPLKTGAKATSEGSGCLVIILGLVLTPLIIGIPIIIYGLHLSSKREGFWRCKRCDATFPREIKWYQLG